MKAAADARGGKRSEARERILATASELFYAEGINSVGVDRIVTDSRVVLATFYRHFPSKEALVVAYLHRVHELVAGQLDALAERFEGADLVRAITGAVAADLGRTGFRGCAFINAASEFEDPQSPVRRAVEEHRRWYYELVRRAFRELGFTLSGNGARHFVMLRDGAMVAGYLDSVRTAQRTFKRGVEGLLRSTDIRPLPGADHEDAP
jgi:AcrR family transcriptional regulator